MNTKVVRRAAVGVLVVLVACLQVDPATWPAPNPGRSTSVVVPATYPQVAPPGDEITAAFRINCQLSHVAYHDPIVNPGATSAHAHQFYGNTGIDQNTTPQSVAATGNSTCLGGTANRSAYWIPAMTVVPAGADGKGMYPWVRPSPVCAPGEQWTQCTEDRDNAAQVYYKSGYRGVLPRASDYPYTTSPSGWVARDVENFPAGLVMIAGNGNATAPQSESVIRWYCSTGGAFNAGITQLSSVMPTCAPGLMLVLTVEFPQCWNGTDLDSPNHQSHMAYGAGWPNLGCPVSHPVPLPEITQLFRWRIPATGMAGWRLASDVDLTKPAGMTAHADVMIGWNLSVFETMLNGCYRIPPAAGRDCRMGLLGNGTMLG